MNNPHFFASQIPHPFHTVLISRKRRGMSYAVMPTVNQDTSDIENMSNEEVNANRVPFFL